MKARVKATGEIFEIASYATIPMECCDSFGEPLRFCFDAVEILSEGNDLKESEAPDYWTRLEHQYAGMAMQGMSEKYLKDYRDYCAGFGDMDKDEAKATMKDFADAMADVCYYFAHALVEKYKKEE